MFGGMWYVSVLVFPVKVLVNARTTRDLLSTLSQFPWTLGATGGHVDRQLEDDDGIIATTVIQWARALELKKR